MICPKCDSRFYENEHCSFCGFVLTRHPTTKEIMETGCRSGNKNGGGPKGVRFQGETNPTISQYSIDDYSIGKLEQERFIREAM